ncbi:MAG: NADH-quinone oxidoreductase subunit J [Caulobacteraceae bacterium]|nr:NADH-quinone oxidoreductase subunit J [Caulobacteraceae bacterium]
MALAAIAFYLLAFITLASGLRVVTAPNPVHSVLFLILAFFSSAGLFVLLGAEFLAMLLVVVYVGAVAVLFLFVVMMLDVDFVALRAGFVRYLPIGLIVAGVIAGEMAYVSYLVAGHGAAAHSSGPLVAGADGVTNAEAIGRVLYTDYVYFFQASGLVLLVAMIGAIVLTLRHRAHIRRQVIADQVARTPAAGLRIVQIKSGEGLK